MPVEIRELIITATVDTNADKKIKSSLLPAADSKKIIEECVEQVLQIIKEKQER